MSNLSCQSWTNKSKKNKNCECGYSYKMGGLRPRLILDTLWAWIFSFQPNSSSAGRTWKESSTFLRGLGDMPWGCHNIICRLKTWVEKLIQTKNWLPLHHQFVKDKIKAILILQSQQGQTIMNILLWNRGRDKKKRKKILLMLDIINHTAGCWWQQGCKKINL